MEKNFDIASNLPNSVDHCLYVDDLTIFTSASSVDVCKRRLQNAVDTVTQAATACGFRFSAEKTKVVDFCRLRTPHVCPDLTMYGAQIQKDAVVKFLGLYYDSYLTWRRHITHLSGQCRMSLNAIKCLSSTKWGADRECLQRLYTALVQSKLDYGCIAFSSAKRCHLQKLNTILNAGIRMFTGAFRTSPVESLCCESGIAPLKYRYMRIGMKYTVGILTKPQHLNNTLLFHNQPAIDVYHHSTSTMCPVAIKLVRQMENLPIRQENVLPCLVPRTPPWCNPTAHANLSLTSLPKHTTPHAMYVQEFYTYLEYYSTSLHVYTDGSKTTNGTGCAFTVNDVVFSYPLSPTCSVYTAELYAIFFALQYCLLSAAGNNSVVIFTDSLSAILSISTRFNTDPLIQAIYDIFSDLHSQHIRVTFMWIPGHVGIPGNHAADQAASEAANSQYVNRYAVRPDDMVTAINQFCGSAWQEEWNLSTGKLKDIKPLVAKWPSPCSVTRREQVLVTRLRIGHTALTHHYLLLGDPAPKCDRCNVRQTVRHILVECPLHTNARLNCDVQGTLAEILANDSTRIKNILKFCKTIGSFSEM